jgi:N-glycosylase/DNA lyase
MTQRGAVFVGPLALYIELPPANAEVLPGIQWGAIEAFPSPAYWTYQVLAHRVAGQRIRYRLGESLREEVAACILGGHGIPAAVGGAAFRRLREREVLTSVPSEDDLFVQLSEPLVVNGRSVRYRFARQKARYLSGALRELVLSN